MARGGLRRVLAASLGAALIASAFAPSAAARHRSNAPSEPPATATSPERFLLDRILRIAEEHGAPRELIEKLGAVDALTTRFVLSLPWPDLTGNGLTDLLVIDLESFGGGVLGSGTLRLTARDGLTGRELWRRTERFRNGIALPVPGRVGRSGRNGAILVEIEDFTFTFTGLSNKGKQIYEHSVSVLAVDDTPLFTRQLVGVGFLNAIPGKATDILFGVARVSNVVLPGGGTANETETTILDGRNGRLITHEDGELSLGGPPVPHPGPDMDGDGLDDYVVVGVLPDLETDDQSGLPETPDPAAHYVRGRGGREGTKLWTSDPVNLGDHQTLSIGPVVLFRADHVFVEDAGDVTADRVGDVLLDLAGAGGERLSDHRFHVLDGATGILAWSGNGELVASVPDIDRDGKRDVFTATGLYRDDKASLKLIAYSGRAGERLYGRSYRLKGVKEGGGTSLLLWRTGDVEPDGLPEFFVRLAWSDGEGASSAREMVVNLRTGRPHRLRLRDNEWIVGPVDGRGDDVIRYLGPGVVVFDGRTDRPLLRVSLSPPGSLSASRFVLSVWATEIDRDRCADLVGTFNDGTNYYSVVIDGGNGTLRWSSREFGTAPRAGPTVASREDLNRSC